MPLILNIDTTTTVCSVSISKDGQTIALRESFEDKTHAKLLTVFIEEVLTDRNIKVSELDAIAISKGPGSYTGLRIGTSVAKGLAYAADLPLIAVDTLQAMAQSVLKNEPTEITDSALLCPMIDARRMEVYTALYDFELKSQLNVEAKVIDETSFSDVLDKQKVLFFGNGAAKCKELIKHENAIFIDQIYTSAIPMGVLADQAFQQAEFEDLAYFEPFYLKEFIATIPKKNIFK